MSPLPPPYRLTFPPAETSFQAQNTLVRINPTQRIDKLQLICGSFGPLEPPLSYKVPFWVGIALRKSDKCRIQCPNWMLVDSLKQLVKAEREEPFFSPLPFYWVEISQALLDCAREDLPNADEMQTLLKDLQEIRQEKINSGLKAMNSLDLGLDNLGCFEINQIRPFFTKAFNELRAMDPEGVILGEQIRKSAMGLL